MDSLPLFFALAAVAAVGLTVGYLVVGAVHDLARRRNRRLSFRMQDDLAVVIAGSDEEAAAAAERLARRRKRTVLGLVQRLSADLDGEAVDRLRSLVAVAGLGRHIRRRVDSRNWRRRAQAAGLTSLLPADDPHRHAALLDPHPVVRARCAEAMRAEDVARHQGQLLLLLDHPVLAVRFAAQTALIRGGRHVVPALQEYLETSTENGVRWGLEVAATIPHPRLVPGVRRHLDSDDPEHRAIAVRAISRWPDELRHVQPRLSDEDETVRAMAAEAAGAMGGQELATQVGRLLGDRSWLVRERAGQALAAMGPAGAMTLRVHLDDADPYAQDMARQVLDGLTAVDRPLVAGAVR